MLQGPLHPEIAGPALGIGVLAAGAAAVRLGRQQPSAWAGAGAVVAVVATQHPPVAATVGLGILAAVGFIPPGIHLRRRTGVLLGAAIGLGLALLASALPSRIESWDNALWLTIGVMAFLAPFVATALGQAVALVLVGVSLAGMWTTVPDTEVPVAVAAAVAPVVVAAILSRRRPRPPDDLARWTGVLAASTWGAFIGSAARPGTAAAAVACYGVLATAGLAFGVTAIVLRGRQRRDRHTVIGRIDRTRLPTTILLVGQVAAVWLAARWDLPRFELSDAWPAIVAAAAVATLAAAAALVRILAAGEPITDLEQAGIVGQDPRPTALSKIEVRDLPTDE